MLNEGFIMGNIEDRLAAGIDKLLQPFQGFDINVVGGFIQQINIRFIA